MGGASLGRRLSFFPQFRAGFSRQKEDWLRADPRDMRNHDPKRRDGSRRFQNGKFERPGDWLGVF
jgi:hypothetical protein